MRSRTKVALNSADLEICLTGGWGLSKADLLREHSEGDGSTQCEATPDSSASSVPPKAIPWSANPNTLADWHGSGSDRLSGENIDAQIRWFFENAVDREPLRP